MIERIELLFNDYKLLLEYARKGGLSESEISRLSKDVNTKIYAEWSKDINRLRRAKGLKEVSKEEYLKEVKEWKM